MEPEKPAEAAVFDECFLEYTLCCETLAWQGRPLIKDVC